jgi:hypothetical protein
MTTENDDLKERMQNQGPGKVESEAVPATSFGDPAGEHPRFEYHNSSSVNQGARTGKMHKLAFGGSVPGVDVDANYSVNSQYPYNDVKETSAGHVLEFNDTPGSERILIKHNSGSGIELRPDGTIVISTLRNKIEVVGGSNTIIVEGDANMHYLSNLTMNVTGDFNVNCHDFNVNAKGNKTVNVDGSARTKIFGNSAETTVGHKSETVVHTTTRTHLGKHTINTKGDLALTTQGNVDITSSGTLTQTAEAEAILSSPNINIAAQDLTVIGNTGTVGGKNVIMYNYNMWTGHTVWAGDTLETQTVRATKTVATDKATATLFVGDLEGTADRSIRADITNSQAYADTNPGGDVGSAQGFTVAETSVEPINFDATVTAQPKEYIMEAYLNNSAKGVRKPRIDEGDHIKAALLQKPMSTQQVREKLRDTANKSNGDFTAGKVASGKLNASYANTVPKGVGRIRSGSPSCQRSTVQLGNASGAGTNNTFRVQEVSSASRIMAVDNKFNPMNGSITASTALADGISMAKFVRGPSAKNFDTLDEFKKQQLARNYYIHAQILNTVMTRPGPHSSRWEDYRLQVVEGFYSADRYGLKAPGSNQMAEEVITPDSLLDKRSKGLVVVYELIGPNGKLDKDATFDLATDLKEKCSHLFDKLILDYDEFDPNGDMNVQIIIEIKSVSETWSMQASGSVETVYNGKVQSTDTITEVLQEKPEPEAPPVPAEPEVPPADKEQPYRASDGSLVYDDDDKLFSDFYSGKYKKTQLVRNNAAGGALIVFHWPDISGLPQWEAQIIAEGKSPPQVPYKNNIVVR